MICPKCGRPVDAAAVICAGCDFILDTSFLGAEILDEERSLRPGPGGIDPAVFNLADAVILGDLDDHAQSFETSDSGFHVRETTGARLYVSGRSQALMAPDAIPARVAARPESVRLTPFEKHILSLIDGQRPVEAIRLEAGLDDSEVKTALATLADKGVVEVIGRALVELGTGSGTSPPRAPERRRHRQFAAWVAGTADPTDRAIDDAFRTHTGISPLAEKERALEPAGSPSDPQDVFSLLSERDSAPVPAAPQELHHTTGHEARPAPPEESPRNPAQRMRAPVRETSPGTRPLGRRARPASLPQATNARRSLSDPELLALQRMNDPSKHTDVGVFSSDSDGFDDFGEASELATAFVPRPDVSDSSAAFSSASSEIPAELDRDDSDVFRDAELSDALQHVALPSKEAVAQLANSAVFAAPELPWAASTRGGDERAKPPPALSPSATGSPPRTASPSAGSSPPFLGATRLRSEPTGEPAVPPAEPPAPDEEWDSDFSDQETEEVSSLVRRDHRPHSGDGEDRSPPQPGTERMPPPGPSPETMAFTAPTHDVFPGDESELPQGSQQGEATQNHLLEPRSVDAAMEVRSEPGSVVEYVTQRFEAPSSLAGPPPPATHARGRTFGSSDDGEPTVSRANPDIFRTEGLNLASTPQPVSRPSERSAGERPADTADVAPLGTVTRVGQRSTVITEGLVSSEAPGQEVSSEDPEVTFVPVQRPTAPVSDSFGPEPSLTHTRPHEGAEHSASTHLRSEGSRGHSVGASSFEYIDDGMIIRASADPATRAPIPHASASHDDAQAPAVMERDPREAARLPEDVEGALPRGDEEHTVLLPQATSRRADAQADAPLGQVPAEDRERSPDAPVQDERSVTSPLPAVTEDQVREQKAARLFAEAQADIAAGRVGAARMNVKLATIYAPENDTYREALERWSATAASAPPADPPYAMLYERARAAEQEGDMTSALALLRQGTREHPTIAAFHNRLGVLVAMFVRDFERAADHIRRAIELEPSNLHYKSNYGKIIARAEAASPRADG